jgi:hypothetical protein
LIKPRRGKKVYRLLLGPEVLHIQVDRRVAEDSKERDSVKTIYPGEKCT